MVVKIFILNLCYFYNLLQENVHAHLLSSKEVDNFFTLRAEFRK